MPWRMRLCRFFVAVVVVVVAVGMCETQDGL